MASAHKDSKGWRVCYIDVNGDRRSIRPGKINKTTAQQIARQVDVLVASKASGGTIELATAKWLGDIGERLYSKLVRAELVEPRFSAEPEPSITLAEFLNEYVKTGITQKGDAASLNTLRNWRFTRNMLLDCFDGSRLVESFTVADGKAFRKWLERRKIPVTPRTPTGKMNETSIRQRVGNAKSMFSHAVKEELLPSNPFRNQVSSLRAGEDGKQNIPAEIIDKVIATAPTNEWRLLIALWRYAGLRKMEPLELTWNDVLWAERKLRVRSSKTKHHSGKGMRYVPSRDVESYLSDAFALAEESEQYLFPNLRLTDVFHRFQSIVEDAGFTPWPNLIKNLRLSCENDWLTANEAPAHVIAAWIGHSVTVQNNAYAIVSDGHFDQFNSRGNTTPKSGNHGGNKAARIDAKPQKVATVVATEKPHKTLKPSENTGFQAFDGYFIKKSVGAEKHGVSDVAAKSGNHGGNHGGNQHQNSDRFAHFVEQLRAAGFTVEQIQAIDAAMVGAGLALVATEWVSE